MKPYDSHPDVPAWLSALNGQLLTTTELNVLNFIFWCNQHGCRTSNDRIGMFTHHSHATVQRAVMKLYSMDLIAIENFGKRTRTLKAVHWPDQPAWLKYKKLQASIEADAAHHAPHILPIDKSTLTGLTMGRGIEPAKTAGRFSPGGCRPQPPACCSVGAHEIGYQLKARIKRDKLIDAGLSKDAANRKVREKYPLALFEEYWNNGTTDAPHTTRLR